MDTTSPIPAQTSPDHTEEHLWKADELAQTPFTAVEGNFPDKRFAQLVVQGIRSGE